MNALNIINSLEGKTYTLGWDAVVAYDRQKVNHLLQQQYVNKLEAGTHFPSVTWENKNKTIRFENITLGTPLISFEKANTENSRASATLEFIDGSVIEKNSNDQVINYIRIRPGMGLTMQLRIDLTTGEGSVDEEGKVLVDFSEGNITQIDLNLTKELLAEVKEYFARWLLDNPVIYELGKLSFQDINTKFVPKKFIIRTQCAPGADLLDASNHGDGAVLLFVATEYNPKGGTLPTNEYPWLIPEENSSAILINNKIVVEHYIKPPLDEILTMGEWILERENVSDNDAYYLKTSADAQINIGPYVVEINKSINVYFIHAVWSGTFEKSTWTGITRVLKDFIYSLQGIRILPNKDAVIIDFNEHKKFYAALSHHCTDDLSRPPRQLAETIEHSFLFNGDVIYKPIIEGEDKLINFKFEKNNVGLTHDMGAINEDPRGFRPIYEELGKKIRKLLIDNMNIINNISFNDISVFAVDKVLFPEQNINQLESAYFPGDLVLFGNIAPALTSLTLSPLTSTVAVGDEVTFATNTEEEVTYTLSPEEAGHITSEGVYSAPDSISGGTLNVTVTATIAEDVSASAHITVVPTPVLLSPSFIVLEEDKLYPIQFNVKVLGERGKLNWELTSSDPEVVGSIDKKGLYTPPDPNKSGEYPKGYTYVTVTATTSDGETSNACIMLVSRKTKPEFNILPSFVNLSPKAIQEFTAEETEDFSPNTWIQYPALGKLSKPKEKNGVYSVNYTVPDELTGDELVIIRAIQKDKEHRAGYSIADLTSDIQSTYDKDNIE